jgi:hypothetical protein
VHQLQLTHQVYSELLGHPHLAQINVLHQHIIDGHQKRQLRQAEEQHCVIQLAHHAQTSIVKVSEVIIWLPNKTCHPQPHQQQYQLAHPHTTK